MKILSVDQCSEINEMMILNKTCPELDQYTRADWIEAYLYILGPAGVDTFCESVDIDMDTILLESNSHINEGFFKNLKNVLKGRKLVKAKYKGYDSAANNYVSQSKSLKQVEDRDSRQKKRIALDKSYDSAIKSIDAKVEKPLSELIKQSPVVAKYAKFAKLKYQLNIFKLSKNAEVSMAKVKSYNSEVGQIKSSINDIASDISSAEKEIKKEGGDKEPSNTDKPNNDSVDSKEEGGFTKEDDAKIDKIEADIKGFEKSKSSESSRLAKLKTELESLEDSKKSATDPDKVDDRIADKKESISKSNDDIKELKSEIDDLHKQLDKFQEK